MNWKCKPSREEALEAYPFVRMRYGSLLVPRNPSCAIYHHAIRHQCIQIRSPESRPLPPTGHPCRLLRCTTRALGHGSQRKSRRGRGKRTEKAEEEEQAGEGNGWVKPKSTQPPGI